MHLHKLKRKKWFTLVELIIVITILAILATLAFVSFQWYFKTSRDSVKVTTLRQYEKWLQNYQVKTWNYPDPENAIDIVGVSYQWYVKDNLKKVLSIRSNDAITNYHYSVTKNKLKYELWVYLEERNMTLFWFISKTYAASDYLKQYFYVLWDNVWILLDKVTWTPVQEIYTWSLDLTTNTWTFIAHFKNSWWSGSVNGSGTALLNNILIVQSSCTPTTYSGYSIPVINYNQSQTVTKTITWGTGSILASCSNNGVLSYGNETITCANGYILQSGACSLVSYVFNQVITTNIANYNLKSAAIAAWWNQVTPLSATITLSGSAYIYSSSTTTPAFDTGNGFPVWTQLVLINYWFIVGKWWNWWYWAMGWYCNLSSWWANATNWWPALSASTSLSITNNGTIGWWGWGWASWQWAYDAASGCWMWYAWSWWWGWAGFWNAAPGGTNGTLTVGWAAWSSTTGWVWNTTSPGAWWALWSAWWSASGWIWPMHGTANTPGWAAGPAVTGNSNITWQSTGTRLWTIQ